MSNNPITDGACQTGFSCGTAVADTGFYQRMVIDTVGQQFFQTIITENSASDAETQALLALFQTTDNTQTNTDLPCLTEYSCGDKITGLNFLQQEITNGTSI